ncbi:MAG: hypothetical protein K2J37_05980 [Ruminococcus sp.]|nr:hypothetical protein [Ruminococcus sp.]MDE6784060.1 hypothetical protein [Ruminococcus sp.]
MNDIITNISAILKESGNQEVYTVYDAQSVRDKGKYFTVVGIKSFKPHIPLYTDTMMYIFVDAEAEITVISPKGSTEEQLYDYYIANIEMPLSKILGINSSIQSIDYGTDHTTGRLKLTIILRTEAVQKFPLEGESGEYGSTYNT